MADGSGVGDQISSQAEVSQKTQVAADTLASLARMRVREANPNRLAEIELVGRKIVDSYTNKGVDAAKLVEEAQRGVLKQDLAHELTKADRVMGDDEQRYNDSKSLGRFLAALGTNKEMAAKVQEDSGGPKKAFYEGYDEVMVRRSVDKSRSQVGSPPGPGAEN